MIKRPDNPPGRFAVPTDQRFSELTWLVDFMLYNNVNSVLSLGSEHAGVEWEMARRYQDVSHPLSIIGLDHRSQLMMQAIKYIQLYCPLVQFTGIQYNLDQPDMEQVLFGRYDFIFIDADHSYPKVKRDFEFALRHTHTYIALHDIVDAPHFGPGDFVNKLWYEIKRDYFTTEKIENHDGYGIGIVDLTGENQYK